MAKYDAGISLAQMRDHVQEALDIAKGKTREDFTQDRLLNLSLTRLLEILGEAANRVPPEIRAKHPDIPWPELVGLRNRLIHAYDDVDLEILWKSSGRSSPGTSRPWRQPWSGSPEPDPLWHCHAVARSLRKLADLGQADRLFG